MTIGIVTDRELERLAAPGVSDAAQGRTLSLDEAADWWRARARNRPERGSRVADAVPAAGNTIINQVLVAAAIVTGAALLYRSMRQSTADDRDRLMAENLPPARTVTVVSATGADEYEPQAPIEVVATEVANEQ